MSKFAIRNYCIDVNQSSTFYKTVFGWNIRKDDADNISFDDTVGQVSKTWVIAREFIPKSELLI